ncbi:MAG: bifunctional DNA-binding transcriptional regulator/O6-methylguanine-DNA methyltransferase Ada [Planctomycetota bacterium]
MSSETARPERLPTGAPLRGDDARWDAVVRRDSSRRGAFVYGVRTTGVYCRPGCPSRTPLRSNVVLLEDADAAERAGFRACKRCRPRAGSADAEGVERVLAACRFLEEAETSPTLAELAAHVGASPRRLALDFEAHVGTTPTVYAAAVRWSRARAALHAGASVTDAAYGSGFGSRTRFSGEARDRLGMTATEFRRGGDGRCVRFAVAPCTLGLALVAATEVGVCAVLLGDRPDELVRDLARRFPKAELVGGDADFASVVDAVVASIDRPSRTCDLPLDVRGTAFQLRVWEELRRIPSGTTRTYGEVARRLGAPRSVRAVARACGENPLAVLVPCHRVLAKSGELTGYRWGLGRKRELLEREERESEARD